MNTSAAIACAADAVTDPRALIVAFASLEGDMVEQHFGSAQAFYLYAITADSAELIASHHFGQSRQDGNEDKLKPKLAWLAGADVVYCASIGGSATRQLVTLGINPIQVSGGPDVEDLISELQAQWRGEQPFWLAKILKQKQQSGAANRFDAMDEEGWNG
jgi:nitrogen fixation protein NifX